MPPKANNVDGVSRPTIPLQTPPRAVQEEGLKAELANEKVTDSKQAQEAKKAAPTGQLKTSRPPRGPAIAIVITVVVMILLIGLAWIAYNKSK